MAKTLKQIDAEISKLIASREYSDEDIFNFGVQIGKLMQATGTTDFRPSIFIEQDERNKKYEADKAHRETYAPLIDRIDKFVDDLMRQAVKEHVKKHWCWTSNKSDYRYTDGLIDDEISKKYCIQFVETKKDWNNDSYSFKFEFIGKLKEFLQSKSLPINFNVHYSNYGTDRKNESIDDRDAIADMSVDYIGFMQSLYDLELAEVEKFWVDLHKPFLFLMMKNS